MSISPELVGYCAAFFTTFSFLPQAILTLRTRDTRTLSLTMYGMFTTGVAGWIVYGTLRNDWVIVTANAITLFFALLILSVKIFNVLSGREHVRPL